MTQLSREPEMSCFMLLLKQTEVTASLWPRKERSRVGSSGCAGCQNKYQRARRFVIEADRSDGVFLAPEEALQGGVIRLCKPEQAYTCKPEQAYTCIKRLAGSERMQRASFAMQSVMQGVE
eukprot:1149592-Pelagomonas_calceolata.AAC.5